MIFSSVFDTAELIFPALVAGLLVASTHVPLGCEVLKRGIIFLDLAIAQIAGLGAIAASSVFHMHIIGQQIFAFFAALLSAYMFSLAEKMKPQLQEALIGCAFVLAASLSILIFAGDPHGNEEISSLMSGQILWIGWKQIGLTALIYIPLLAVLFFKPNKMRYLFYPIFAACITLSVQLVGVYLVFASLILPALASHRFSGGQAMIVGYSVSVLAVLGGLIFSILMDLPSGPVIICFYALAALLPGLLFKLNPR